MPTGSERTVWGMGDGSTLDTYPTPFGRIGGLICWENYMPLARFYLYSQGVDVWVAPTLATGDGWVATMRHIAREGRCYVIGVNPCLRVDQIPADFPDRERVWRTDPEDPEWVEPGNTVIVGPNGEILAGPARHDRDRPRRRAGSRARCFRRGGCSTRSATTTVPTCSGSPSTPRRGRLSPSCAAAWPTADHRERLDLSRCAASSSSSGRDPRRRSPAARGSRGPRSRPRPTGPRG